MNHKWLPIILILVLGVLSIPQLQAGGEWFKVYGEGLKAMKRGNYEQAARRFKEAIKGNPTDKRKVRTYGLHFIEYFPHRELGICLYNLGNTTAAQRELKKSLQDEPSARANEYLRQIGGGVPPKRPKKKEQDPKKVDIIPVVKPTKETDMIVGKQTIKLVGERMGVAVMPFENKGASRDLGEIILDKMITVMWNQDRFKVME